MKLLVIDDEVKLAEYLRKGLTEEGFVVDLAHNGVDGLHLAMESDYELIVLDGMLPGIDGLSLLAERRQSKQTPVLMLTARVRVEDRVRGLQSGADDYLVKPFAFSELLARIQVLLRRTRPARATDGATVLGLADLEIDLIRRKAVRSGRRLELTAQEQRDRIGVLRTNPFRLPVRVMQHAHRPSRGLAPAGNCSLRSPRAHLPENLLGRAQFLAGITHMQRFVREDFAAVPQIAVIVREIFLR